MRRLSSVSLALATVAAATVFVDQTPAGSGQTSYNFNQQNAQAPLKRQKKGSYRSDRLQEQKAFEIRKECRMYSFRHWRYHPDYQHCRYY